MRGRSSARGAARRSRSGACATIAGAMALACARCDSALPAGARFCPACGASRDADDRSRTRLADTEAASSSETRARSVLPPMRLEPGTRVSSYRIESVVGEGGMGVVYRAHDEALDRTVALKCLHTNLSGDPQIRRRFAREAKVLRSWEHPNVVRVHDFVEEEHLLAIVMELVEGRSLVQHLARWRGEMPLGEVRSSSGRALHP